MGEVELQMTDLNNVSLKQEYPAKVMNEVSFQGEEGKKTKVKVPRRVLHFSDGTMEEYSTDDEDETDNKPDTLALVDPKSLSWGPWMYYWMYYTGSKTLSACDYVGEGLAHFLGITSPKYQYEIDEYKRCEEEEKAEREEEAAEMAGWTTAENIVADGVERGDTVVCSAIRQPPSPSHAKNEILSVPETTHDTSDQEDKASQSREKEDSQPQETDGVSRWERF
nr:protein FAM177A1-like isoform X2 [Cherax quadricarinatus]